MNKVSSIQLTATEQSWLVTAHKAGEGEGKPFYGAAIRALKVLESHKLIERDPSTKGRNTRWRITEHGEKTLLALKLDELS
jgi:hypothetical protein